MRNVTTREGYEFWDKICSLTSYGFLLSPNNRIQRAPGIGNWIDKHEAQVIVDQAQDEINGLKEERDALLTEVARLKEVANFQDAVACVFDYLKFAAANTSSREWDDQLEELAEDVIEYAPEYKKQWKDICKLQASLTASEKMNKELSKSLDQAVTLLAEAGLSSKWIGSVLEKD